MHPRTKNVPGQARRIRGSCWLRYRGTLAYSVPRGARGKPRIKEGGENKVDDCANCFYRVYCERSFKFFQVNPCNLVLPDDADKLRQIDLITEDLRAQYDN